MIDAAVLAVALAMDATALAVACGAAGATRSSALRMAWLFALAHVVMLSAGWLIGATFERWIAAWDHWLVFGLLVTIGGKMIWTAMRPDAVDVPAGWRMLIALALATSIDAIGAGVTLPLVGAPESVTIGLVGGVVFALVLAGAHLGASVGARFGRGLQVAGGLAIIGLGVRALVEHLS